MELIDKAAVVAEIERRKEINKYRDTDDGLFEDEAILSFINTLEVKKIDLEDIIDQTYHNRSVTDTSDIDHVAYENIAEYFFKLGLNTHK